MDSSDQGSQAPEPVFPHPDASVDPAVLHAAYTALFAALARHEADALRRITRILSDEESSRSGDSPPAVELARAWLVFTGQGERVEASPPERTFGFAFPATVTFDLVGAGTPKSAGRRALRALRSIQSDDLPLGAMSGPHPLSPDLLNLTVWAGSFLHHSDDRLVLELATDDDER